MTFTPRIRETVPCFKDTQAEEMSVSCVVGVALRLVLHQRQSVEAFIAVLDRITFRARKPNTMSLDYFLIAGSEYYLSAYLANRSDRLKHKSPDEIDPPATPYIVSELIGACTITLS